MRALAILLLTACSVSPPDRRGIDVADIYKVSGQDKAMLLAESMVEDAYGYELEHRWQDTTVYWTDTVCYYDDSRYAVLYDYDDGPPRCLAGLTFSCQEMYVAVNADRTTCGTALVHEFGHCLHLEIFGIGDGGHTNADFWGLIADVAGLVCDRGW